MALKLETGRTHQIRVHLSHIMLPIVGDSVYTRSKKARQIRSKRLLDGVKRVKRQMLHAATLGFIHPGDKREMSFSSDLPDDMKDLLKLTESVYGR